MNAKGHTSDCDDFRECEALIKLLSPAKQKVIDGCPVWYLDPPQRESYNTPIQYVAALAGYADRVIQSRECLDRINEWVRESRLRMDHYTPERRATLYREAIKIINGEAGQSPSDSV